MVHFRIGGVIILENFWEQNFRVSPHHQHGITICLETNPFILEIIVPFGLCDTQLETSQTNEDHEKLSKDTNMLLTRLIIAMASVDRNRG